MLQGNAVSWWPAAGAASYHGPQYILHLVSIPEPTVTSARGAFGEAAAWANKDCPSALAFFPGCSPLDIHEHPSSSASVPLYVL